MAYEFNHYYEIQNVATGKYVNVLGNHEDGTVKNGETVNLFNRTNNPDQRWALENFGGNGNVRIVLQRGEGWYALNYNTRNTNCIVWHLNTADDTDTVITTVKVENRPNTYYLMLRDRSIYLTAVGTALKWSAYTGEEEQMFTILEPGTGSDGSDSGEVSNVPDSKLVTKFIPAHEGNYTKDRKAQGGTISEITIHHCASILTIDALGALWQREGRKGSSHYGVSETSIGQYVHEDDVPWTNGNWEANCRAVTIETSNSGGAPEWPVSDTTFQTLVRLSFTVLSAFAQAESESISQNISRGKRMGFRHGRFSFPYAQMLGYRKGADGQPEIIPEQAELIRMIYTSYLHGDSLQTIKGKVEAGGYKTVRGNTTWSTQALLRILQNEKYCGDVLLQKTFTDNVLTGGPKKNTGQLPQYYIENNHEGIVTKQMYREVQAEIARRNSKSCANRRKQKRGRYNSKYALSERLYCGECGSPYKRVTWNIHGRKEIVWRCVNRVTYGTKFCHNSPSVQEEALHQTLLRSIQNLADNYTEEVAMQINGILHDLQGGTTELEKLQQKLADSQQEFDRLLDMSLECDASFLDEKLKHASEEIDNLQKQVDQLTASQQKAANPNLQLTDSDFRITEYSDTLVARIIERIEVISAVRIKIEFIGGYTVTVPLQS